MALRLKIQALLTCKTALRGTGWSTNKQEREQQGTRDWRTTKRSCHHEDWGGTRKKLLDLLHFRYSTGKKNRSPTSLTAATATFNHRTRPCNDVPYLYEVGKYCSKSRRGAPRSTAVPVNRWLRVLQGYDKWPCKSKLCCGVTVVIVWFALCTQNTWCGNFVTQTQNFSLCILSDHPVNMKGEVVFLINMAMPSGSGKFAHNFLTHTYWVN